MIKLTIAVRASQINRARGRRILGNMAQVHRPARVVRLSGSVLGNHRISLGVVGESSARSISRARCFGIPRTECRPDGYRPESSPITELQGQKCGSRDDCPADSSTSNCGDASTEYIVIGRAISPHSQLLYNRHPRVDHGSPAIYLKPLQEHLQW